MIMKRMTCLSTASSSSYGLLVAPITKTRSSFPLCTWNHKTNIIDHMCTIQLEYGWKAIANEKIRTPSNSNKNSVFSLRLASCSPSLLEHNSESISSRKREMSPPSEE